MTPQDNETPELPPPDPELSQLAGQPMWPLFEYLAIRDGVVEYVHPAGEIVRRAMSENPAEEISRDVDALQRAADGARGQFDRCRAAGNALAAAVAALPESDAKTALYPAWETFMSLDSGNFEPPYSSS